MDRTQWTEVARLLRPQGRHGEILADPLTDRTTVFAAGCRVAVAGVSTDPLETTIENHWFPTGRNAGRVVLKLAGCDNISDAERLAQQDLLIPSDKLPALDEGTWYVRDLLGCTLFDGEVPVGTITGIQYPVAADGRTRLPDAAPLLELSIRVGSAATPSPEDEEEPVLVPFIRAWLETVDLKARRVVMHLPPGLLAVTPEP